MHTPKGILVALILILTLMVSGTYTLYTAPDMANASAVGFIGGSDGPTAVFVGVSPENADLDSDTITPNTELP